MHDIIEHSTVPTPTDSNHLQRGEVIVEKNGQGEVTVLHFVGGPLRKARNNDELQKLAQDYLASYELNASSE